MKHFAYWTDERKRLAADLYAQGLNCAQIAERLASNPMRVRKVLASLGIKYQKFVRDSLKTWTPQRDGEVSSLYLSGWTQEEIAKRFRTNDTRVREALRRCGIRITRCKNLGPKNPAWKGGRWIDDDGYVCIYSPAHPHARKDGTVLEHRLVMEKVLGRYLEPQEVVHHREEPKSNNDPSNLRLYASNAEHLRDELTGRCPNWTPDGLRRMRARQHRP
jgi:hypothetical protein